MRYSSILTNDIVNGEGICVSFWCQGCPTRCPGCHNQDLWEFDGGQEFTNETLDTLIKAISANGVIRNFSILGGEPLCDQNLFLTTLLIQEIRKVYPDIKIYLWTGYEYEKLIARNDPHINYIFSNIDFLIDGPYIESKRDISLHLRGSDNQRIIDIKQA